MTATNGALPVIDLNTIRSILYLGMKGGVTRTTPPPPGSTTEARTGGSAAAVAAPREAPVLGGGIDTWA